VKQHVLTRNEFFATSTKSHLGHFLLIKKLIGKNDIKENVKCKRLTSLIILNTRVFYDNALFRIKVTGI
jgi:hypothetical protein